MRTGFESGHLTWVRSCSADVVRLRTGKALLEVLVRVWGATTFSGRLATTFGGPQNPTVGSWGAVLRVLKRPDVP